MRFPVRRQQPTTTTARRPMPEGKVRPPGLIICTCSTQTAIQLTMPSITLAIRIGGDGFGVDELVGMVLLLVAEF